MLMPNSLGSAGPPVWINQATLSVVDSNPSEDPENSGFNTIQVSVWEEWNGLDFDIWMKYSLADGALGTWVFPAIQPAVTALNEINPAVTVTNADITGAFQVHVVYQVENPAFPLTWDVMHTYTLNFGIAWVGPFIMDRTAANDAIDPAIVYTEDTSNPMPPAAWYGMSVQIVWSEIRAATGLYDVLYDAWSYDVVTNAWFYAGPITVRISINAGLNTRTCTHPEIASIDDIILVGPWDYYLHVVWEETWTAPGVLVQTDIFYRDGMMTVTPGAIPPPPLPTAAIAWTAAAGQLNTNPIGTGNCYGPDIAATQDYQLPAVALEEYYIHVNWVYIDTTVVPNTYQIDTCYAAGPVAAPGAGVFVATAPAVGPGLIVLDRPTIAAKLVARIPWQGATVFETWMCWEDNTVAASAPDIWYRVGQHNVAGPPFFFIVAAAIVPYVQPMGGAFEYNPELWNRNEITRLFPPFTHLVFDMTTGLNGNPEIEYIDP
jgi:hypothetical protein